MSNPASWAKRVAGQMGLVFSGDLPATDPARAPARGFDWTGVVVSHWFVIGPSGERGKRDSQLWFCVSRCGVRSVFRADALAAGATQTCEACCAGATATPPAYRVVTGDLLDEARRAIDEEVFVEFRTNVIGREAQADWDEHGQPALDTLFERSGLGKQFGWKVTVRDCHSRDAKVKAVRVRVRKRRDAQRSVELAVVGRAYWFEVDVATGRTDRPWDAVVRAIELTTETLRKEAKAAGAGDAEDAPAAVRPKAEANGHHAVVPAAAVAPAADPAAAVEERLVRLRSGLDRAIEFRREAATAGAILAEQQQAVDAARAEAAPLKAALDAATRVASAAATEAAAAQEEADRLAAQLRAATERRDRLAAESAAAREAAEQAAGAFGPAQARLREAEANLAEAERMEADRKKTQAAAGDLSVLLAALEKLGI